VTIDQSTHPGLDPARLAAAARSILSCPDDVQLVVDGVDDISAGLDAAAPGADPGLTMQDLDGSPVFSCPPDAALARAATDGRKALLTLTSGLGAPGSAEREATLALAGRLRTSGVDDCACCTRPRAVVAIDLDFVMLTRAGHDTKVRVPLAAFTSSDHHLNRGFLQRSVEHANSCHQEELRHAVSTTTGTRLGDIGGVGLADLRPDRVEVRWVASDGAYSTVLRFEHAATTTYELGELLREELHAGLC
jgi:hypothetical protein